MEKGSFSCLTMCFILLTIFTRYWSHCFIYIVIRGPLEIKRKNYKPAKKCMNNNRWIIIQYHKVLWNNEISNIYHVTDNITNQIWLNYFSCDVHLGPIWEAESDSRYIMTWYRGTIKKKHFCLYDIGLYCIWWIIWWISMSTKLKKIIYKPLHISCVLSLERIHAMSSCKSLFLMKWYTYFFFIL